jgi:acyl carrier protein
MGKDYIVEKVNEFLIEEFELEKDQLIAEALMKDDLDIESLDFVDIAVVIEKEFGLKVTSEQMVKIKTLDDLYNFILEQQKN